MPSLIGGLCKGFDIDYFVIDVSIGSAYCTIHHIQHFTIAFIGTFIFGAISGFMDDEFLGISLLALVGHAGLLFDTVGN